VKVPHSKDLASHTVPESCVAYREVRREALTGVRIGQPSSRESFNIQGADAVSVAEGNTGWSAIASSDSALRGLIPICVMNSDNIPYLSGGSRYGTSGRWSRACGGGTRVVAQREDR